MPAAIHFQDVVAAAARIAPFCHRTQPVTSHLLDGIAGLRLVFKPENLQRTGSFKCRGATSAVAVLAAAGVRAVATHSAGNHGAALAFAARAHGLECHVVVPSTAPRVKQDAIEGYGARLVLCEPTLAARETTCAAVMDQTGAVLVPPYDHPDIMAGQGTIGLEMLEDTPDLDALVIPVGGGGLCAGVCIAARHLSPRIRLFGAEPLLADDARRSLAAGEIIPSTYPDTVADGLRTSVGELPFAILRTHLEDILTATEAEILAAMALIYTRLKLVVEPSGAVGLAAVLANLDRLGGLRVGIVLSGGNVDPSRLGEFFLSDPASRGRTL
ncbi:pyridoxal-phosphate dependent enzyme [Myxococcota bacterium]|nr:pyridoxal-phosphate dependent enzyme [Myxococcota bacterium]MBU1413827.1 pyridoxal-phosphate dependent enzyme [Myxococcota bacterium]MBU1510491.1 pyridoxal-phosphate dependent enzyme [Myxococcota bacterium]